MIPAQLAAVVALVFGLLCGGGAWYVTDLRADAKIAAIEKKVADDDRKEAVDSLNQMTGQLEAVHDAAEKAVTQLAVTNGALAKIGKGLKNAPPLPTDCKPDTARVQSLDAALEAVNAATARHGSGR